MPFLHVHGEMIPMILTNNGIWADRVAAIVPYVDNKKQEQQQQHQHQKQQQQRKQQQQAHRQIQKQQQQQQHKQQTQHRVGKQKRQEQEPEEVVMMRKIPKLNPHTQIENLHDRVTEVNTKLKKMEKIINDDRG